MITARINLSASARAELERNLEYQAQAGIRISVDALHGRVLFCTSRHMLLTATGLTDAELEREAERALLPAQQAGYIPVVSTWTAEEPEPGTGLVAQVNAHRLDPTPKHRLVLAGDRLQKDAYVLRQTAPAALYSISPNEVLSLRAVSRPELGDELPGMLRAAQQWYTLHKSLRRAC